MSKYENWKDEPFAACENPDVPNVKWIQSKIDMSSVSTILDVGCGTGIHTKWFNANNFECHGITINQDEIQKRVHPKVLFGDMCDIPFPNNSFDLVFMLGSLEHTYSPFIALAEANRVLKPGGYLFFDMPNIYNMEILDKGYYYHKSVLFPLQIRDLLIKSQFEIVAAEYEESIAGVMYTASSQGSYLVKKIRDLSFHLNK